MDESSPRPVEPQSLEPQSLEPQPLEPQRDATPVASQVGRALRMARRRRGLSQRELAQKIGVSKSRLGRLESDAGPQSLEMVAQVLMAAGYRLEVVDTSAAARDAGAERPKDVEMAAALLELCDVSGRRFPAHLEAHRLAYPPTYWFVRNGGWTTTKAFPEWTFERRFVPRAGPVRPRTWDHCYGGGESEISPGQESSS